MYVFISIINKPFADRLSFRLPGVLKKYTHISNGGAGLPVRNG